MSRENRVMSQHIIQRALLERFANSDGKNIIHRFDGNRFVKSYPSYPRNVACADNYYDVDPYSETSLEAMFRPRERKGQRSMDHVLDGECDERQLESIVDYVGMMLGRDPSLLGSLKRTYTRLTGRPFDEDIELKLKHLQYKMSEDGMLLQTFDELTAFTRTLAGTGLFLLTGDHPYIVIDFNRPGTVDGLWEKLKKTDPDDLMDSLIEEVHQVMRNIVVAVPISPTTCVFVRNRGRPDVENIISEETFVSVLHLINTKIVVMADSEVYGDRNYSCALERIRTYIPILQSSDPLLELKRAIVGYDVPVFNQSQQTSNRFRLYSVRYF